jgi:hypothetical protein
MDFALHARLEGITSFRIAEEASTTRELRPEPLCSRREWRSVWKRYEAGEFSGLSLELLPDALTCFTPPDHASSLVVKYEAYVGSRGPLRMRFARRAAAATSGLTLQ